MPQSAAPEALADLLSTIIATAGVLVGLIGAAVICWGVGVGFLRLVRLELQRLTGRALEEQRHMLRRQVAYYLLVGLEFLVAADILETIAAPDLRHLAILGGIVVIRTVISLTLTWEMKHAEGSE